MIRPCRPLFYNICFTQLRYPMNQHNCSHQKDETGKGSPKRGLGGKKHDEIKEHAHHCKPGGKVNMSAIFLYLQIFSSSVGLPQVHPQKTLYQKAEPQREQMVLIKKQELECFSAFLNIPQQVYRLSEKAVPPFRGKCTAYPPRCTAYSLGYDVKII